ncbi:MAG: hypothetical protein KAS02_01585 [Candidatus Pacebacteria bacterium]|nr:hypothetical protein [Candidatus Paceibacterota bacterium]
MKNIKGVLLGFLFLGMLIIPNSSLAVTIDELQAQISSLLAMVASLQEQLIQQGGTTPVQNVETWCHTFNTALKYGDSGAEVDALQNVLTKEGFGISKDKIGYFGEHTSSSVVGFQQKYQKEILAPWGMSYGTGYVGKTTREKLNQLYGCGSQMPSIVIKPIISPIIEPKIEQPCEDCGVVSTASCTDSDGGKNKYIAGKTILSDDVHYDSCYETSVVEYYCSIENRTGQEFIEKNVMSCEFGCEEGSCFYQKIIDINGEKQTYNSKEPIKLTIKGIEVDGSPATREEGWNIQYYTYNAKDNSRLEEYISTGNYNARYNDGYWYVEYWAPEKVGSYYTVATLYCSDPNSKCRDIYQGHGLEWKERINFNVNTSMSLSCKDSDGENFYTKGITCLIDENGDETCKSDQCLDSDCDGCQGNQIVEYYCDGNDIQSDTFTCPNGCDNGVCNPMSIGINTPPQIIIFPEIAELMSIGKSYLFKWNAIDSDNDNLSWSVDWGDGTGMAGACQSPSSQDGQGWAFSTDHAWQKDGIYTIKTSVSDCNGGTDNHNFNVRVLENIISPECRNQDYGCSNSTISCCAGLKAVADCFEVADQDGNLCACSTCGSICLPCGNGVCEDGENACNCPEDCKDIVVPETEPFAITFPSEGASLAQAGSYNITWAGEASNPVITSYSVYLVGGTLESTDKSYLGIAYLSQDAFQWSIPLGYITSGPNFQIQFEANIRGPIIDPVLSAPFYIVDKKQPFCLDSDGGKNYSVFGETCGEFGCNTDVCRENTIEEYYCENDTVMMEADYYCEGGCSNGACLPLTPPTPAECTNDGRDWTCTEVSTTDFNQMASMLEAAKLWLSQLKSSI